MRLLSGNRPLTGCLRRGMIARMHTIPRFFRIFASNNPGSRPSWEPLSRRRRLPQTDLESMTPLAVICTVLGYIAVLFVVAWLSGRRADNAGFFTGNRRTPWYMAAFAMIGAAMSGVTFISVPGSVAADAFSYMQMVAGLPWAARGGLHTDPDLLPPAGGFALRVPGWTLRRSCAPHRGVVLLPFEDARAPHCGSMWSARCCRCWSFAHYGIRSGPMRW